MKKIVSVVGARPQFIKAAAISRKLREKCNEILVHTGQHYDKNMSGNFFEELKIPMPDYSLNVGSGTQGEQTGKMLEKIEAVLIKEKPDAVLVYGDTNSTLAGALAAAKLGIPIIHIEAGLRSYNKNMPEEINRVLTDHMSNILFCPTDVAVHNLKNEGITNSVYRVGDVMCDTVLFYTRDMDRDDNEYFKHILPLKEKKWNDDNWYLATIHRAENTDSIEKMRIVLNAINQLDSTVIFPVHPRIRKYIDTLSEQNEYLNIFFTEPLGYRDMLYFTKYAKKIVTDSGGLQKEAYILNTPCVTVREQTEWVETLNGNYNILAKLDENDIKEKLLNTKVESEKYENYYGDGNAGKEICDIIGSSI